MASILVLTKNKRGLSLCNRLAREGNLVKVTEGVSEPFSHINLTSLFNPTGLLNQFDLCLCLHHELGDIAELAIEMKIPTLLGCQFVKTLYSDRQFYERTYKLLVKEPQNLNEYVETWFNGQDFFLTHLVKVQHRLMEGDRGPTLGATLLSYELTLQEEKERQWEGTGREFLNKINYQGPTQGPIPLGFTPAFFTFLEGCYKVFPTLMALVHKEELQLRPDLACGVKVTFPSVEQAKEVKLTSDSIKHLDWFNENELYVTARGETLRECKRRIQRTIDQLSLSKEAMYRGDL